MANKIVNRVAQSALITFDLEDYYPQGKRCSLDISQWLEEGVLLREKDFRNALNAFDFSPYKDCYVALQCSTDALLPAWAPLLVTAHLQPIAKKVVWGTLAALEMAIFTPIIAQLKGEDFAGKPVIIKGCTHHFIPQSVYVALLQKLQPYAKRLMYGEACSSVPLVKK